MTELRASDTVAAKIRSLREAVGWSRRRMAEYCGLSESVIENIESGRPGDDGNRRRDVTIDELLIISRALDINLLALLPNEAAVPGAYERDLARKKQAERQGMIEERMHTIREVERRLQVLRQQRAKVEADIEESVAVIELCQQEIRALREERG